MGKRKGKFTRGQALKGNCASVAGYIFQLIVEDKTDEALRFAQECLDLQIFCAGLVIADEFFSEGGITPDSEKWLKYMRIAANDEGAHGAECAYRLSEHFISLKNFTEAHKWLHKSVNRGLDEAAVALGYLYEQGKGVPKDLLTAAQWFLKVDELPNSGSCRSIGFNDWPVLHEQGWVSTEKLKHYLAELIPEHRGQLIRMVGAKALAACDTIYCLR